LSADIAGRLVLYPGELEAGIVTAFTGAPVLIALARRRKVSGL
jgi:iron complex transport system permease protein